MWFQHSLVLCCLGALVSPAFSVPTTGLPKRQSSSDPDVDDSCGAIFDFVIQGDNVFAAVDVYNCLVSVPFHADVALRFVDYLNGTLQYQSTQAYLKAPPAGYQQPPVDLFGGLGQIKQRINSGFYKNEYAFEIDVQRLMYQAHDSHLDLYAGIIIPFTYASPVDIVSVSKDGKSPPSVYLLDDAYDSQRQGWTPSPISKINGVDVITYLTDLALVESFGNVEPHADWNQLMGNPALNIQGESAYFSGGLTFYPGDALNFTLANGTTYDTIWIAYYVNTYPTGPLTTGGDFYNSFVLNLLPAACDGSAKQPASCNYPTDPSETLSTASLATASAGLGAAIMSGLTPSTPSTSSQAVASPTKSSWYDTSFGAYPKNPLIVQPDLEVAGDGSLTGYNFEDISTAVLSIPTFLAFDEGIETFADTVGDFVSNASDKGVKHVIIDLQQNTGGNVLLALSTFVVFFPNIEPYAASRRRDHREERILGETLTRWWNSLSASDKQDVYAQYSANEFIVTSKLNAETGRNFTSFAEFYGPRRYQGDEFSLDERYDLDNPTFDDAAFFAHFALTFAERTKIAKNAWAAEDVVLLTDGLCASACTLFVELMTHQAGVRTVVMGGRPSVAGGPMQAASGTRGAAAYSADDVDSDISLAESFNTTVEPLLPRLTGGYRESGIFELFTGFNLRDQVRKGESIPLQFKYLAADCRLYYTLHNIYNFTELWHDAYKAMWVDSSLCVTGSTGYTAKNGTAAKAPPPRANYTVSNQDLIKLPSNAVKETIAGNHAGIQDGPRILAVSSDSLTPCDSTRPCLGGTTCQSVTVSCQGPGGVSSNKKVKACLSSCKSPDSRCPFVGYECKKTTKVPASSNKGLKAQPQFNGVCKPGSGVPTANVCAYTPPTVKA